MADTDAGTSPAQDGATQPVRRWPYRLAFFVTAAFLAVVFAMLPTGMGHLYRDLRSQALPIVYDVFTGQEFEFSAEVPPESAFINVAMSELDETAKTVDLAVSGNRLCPGPCPPVTMTLFSLGQFAAERLGISPSASVALPAASGPFTQQVTLPVAGWPQRYPFDTYQLTLGIEMTAQGPGGLTIPLDAAMLAARGVRLSVEDRVTRLTMTEPVPLDPAAYVSPATAARFVAVDRITWERPRYLRTLTILLVLLIAASAIFALSLKKVEDLLLGIGGIILGVWGVRSVIVQTPLPDLTVVDVTLALIILVLLLALAVRVTMHFYRLAGFGKGR